jgi:prepilin-type N-terminal cleavage/methylation domain-containing protein
MRGFTLIEILVVMVIIGLIAGVALPRFFAMSQSYERAAQRQNFLIDIGNLGYRAYNSGQTLELASPAQAASSKDLLSIPTGWQFHVAKPILYDFNGICSGGQISLTDPDGALESFQLTPPLCQPMASALLK